VIVEDDNIIALGGIRDDRDSKEGIFYDIKNSSKERRETFKKKIEFINDELN